MSDIVSLAATETLALLAEKRVSPEEVAAAYSARIREVDGGIGAYLHVRDEEEVLTEARKATGVLGGLPIAHKDIICVAGMPATGASRMLEGYVPPYTATVAERLAASGCVTLGKVNCDEFAMGGSTENSGYQVTRNPWDTERVPGGSSGGSAAAVAADMCVFATATDTGGSIRQPSSFCNTVGLKVTYGRVSRYGVMAMASSLDTVSVITKCVADTALALHVCAGRDVRDGTSAMQEVPDYTALLARENLSGVRVGVPKEYFIDGMDGQARAVVEAGIRKLEELGATIVPVSLPYTDYAIAAYYLIVGSEVSANMARFDGIRYGETASTKEVDGLVELYMKNREKLGAEVKRRILLGTFALSSGYADQYYKNALRVRTLIKRDFDAAFEQVDVLAGPVSPGVAFRIGEKVSDPMAMYLEDVFTVPINLAGVPAISVPAGFAGGLPVGMQLIAPQFGEGTLLTVASVFEAATGYGKMKPPC